MGNTGSFRSDGSCAVNFGGKQSLFYLGCSELYRSRFKSRHSTGPSGIIYFIINRIFLHFHKELLDVLL